MCLFEYIRVVSVNSRVGGFVKVIKRRRLVNSGSESEKDKSLKSFETSCRTNELSEES